MSLETYSTAFIAAVTMKTSPHNVENVTLIFFVFLLGKSDSYL